MGMSEWSHICEYVKTLGREYLGKEALVNLRVQKLMVKLYDCDSD
jgi:hypothetical protein